MLKKICAISKDSTVFKIQPGMLEKTIGMVLFLFLIEILKFLEWLSFREIQITVLSSSQSHTNIYSKKLTIPQSLNQNNGSNKLILSLNKSIRTISLSNISFRTILMESWLGLGKSLTGVCRCMAMMSSIVTMDILVTIMKMLRTKILACLEFRNQKILAIRLTLMMELYMESYTLLLIDI